MVDSINSNQLSQDDQVNRPPVLTALEFYSGIGGMRFALEGAVEDPHAVKVLAAFDINPHANQVYLHNFGDAVTSANLDNTMNADKLGRFKADIYLMSPPCQPYTRTGHQNQAADPRSKSFLAFLEALPILDANNKAPKYLFIENVLGFESSNTRDLLVQTAHDAHYRFQEFLINPMHLGIPNSRTRYYFMAKHVSLGPFKNQELDGQLLRSDMTEDVCWRNFCSTNLHLNFQATPTLSNFFSLPMHNLEAYRIPQKIFDKHAMVYDIVHPQVNHTCCFTKGYGTYAQATGSILNFGSEPNGMKWEDHRYFTEYEIAQLMGFPISDSKHHFLSFPDSTSLRQRYKLLGNSLNVMVVSKLLAYLLS